MYASAEESAAQLQLRAHRLGLDRRVCADRHRGARVHQRRRDHRRSAGHETGPARRRLGPDRRRGRARRPARFGRAGPGSRRPVSARARTGEDIPVLLVGHVTKDGSLAGPRTLEHLVDVVLMLEGDRYGALRLLRALKNRFGSTEEIGVLEMTGDGLREVARPGPGVPGRRPRGGARGRGRRHPRGQPAPARRGPGAGGAGGMGLPRRTLAGIDGSRIALIVAVLARRAGLDVGGQDVYAAVTGGLEVTETAARPGDGLRDRIVAATARSRPARSPAARCRSWASSARFEGWSVG